MGYFEISPWYPITLRISFAGKNESEEKRELIFKEDGQGGCPYSV